MFIQLMEHFAHLLLSVVLGSKERTHNTHTHTYTLGICMKMNAGNHNQFPFGWHLIDYCMYTSVCGEIISNKQKREAVAQRMKGRTVSESVVVMENLFV